MILLTDVTSLDYGSATYTVTLNDEEFNLVVLLLASLSAREIFADYDTDADLCEAIYADAMTGLTEGI